MATDRAFAEHAEEGGVEVIVSMPLQEVLKAPPHRSARYAPSSSTMSLWRAAISRSCCAEIPDIGSVTECESGLEAIEEIKRSRPDLVFFDVQMPACDGFDVIERCWAAISPDRHIRHRARRICAARVRSGGARRIAEALRRRAFQRALSRAKDRLAREQPHRPLGAVAVKSAGQTLFSKVGNRLGRGRGYYACLHVEKTSTSCAAPLSELERDLDAARFCRIHRSAMVL